MSAPSLRQSLQKIIASRGPISVASYMQQSLVHPTEGYYVTRDPLGAKGDFTTSPEISQMFGELIGINLITQWLAHGQPANIRLVELGPGRGTLMADLLRASRAFGAFHKSIKHVDLVEASPALQNKQKEALSGLTSNLNWLAGMPEIPKDGVPTFVVAHEFFDALPIHQYRKRADDWIERLVDFDPASDSFRFTWAQRPDKMVSTALQSQPRFRALPTDSEIEVCYDAMEIARQLSAIIKHNQGGALIVDYGPMATIPVNTFRGFKEHHQVEPLAVAPGEADLTADVDFRALQDIFGQQLHCSGPVKQADWLHRMGIGARATVLANSQPTQEGKDRVASSYNRLVDANHMGKTYKFLGVSSLPAPIEGFQAL